MIGEVLGAGFGALARARGTRALHPVGICGRGALTTTPGPSGGVTFLEQTGPHPVRVRASRAIGLPDRPDIEGIALQLEAPGGGEILFASTGMGVVTRHVLALRQPVRPGPLTTLLPLATAAGNLLVALQPEPLSGETTTGPPVAYRVLISAPGRPWHERGKLQVEWSDHDCPRRHDPVAYPPEGTWVSPFWAAVRRPAYQSSQEVSAQRWPRPPEDAPRTSPGV